MPTVPSNMIAPPAGDPVAQDGAPAMESAFAGPRQARGVAPADGQVGERGPAIDHLRIEWSAVSPDRATPGLPAERAPPLVSPLLQIQPESVADGHREVSVGATTDSTLARQVSGQTVSAGRTVKAPLMREPVTARPLSAPAKAKHERTVGGSSVPAPFTARERWRG